MQMQPRNTRAIRELIADENARAAVLERELQSERVRQAGLRARIDELNAQIRLAEECTRSCSSSSIDHRAMAVEHDAHLLDDDDDRDAGAEIAAIAMAAAERATDRHDEPSVDDDEDEIAAAAMAAARGVR